MDNGDAAADAGVLTPVDCFDGLAELGECGGLAGAGRAGQPVKFFCPSNAMNLRTGAACSKGSSQQRASDPRRPTSSTPTEPTCTSDAYSPADPDLADSLMAASHDALAVSLGHRIRGSCLPSDLFRYIVDASRQINDVRSESDAFTWT
ncbi:hypothetical protein [Streptomyces sp. NPDC092295]|uniref:hypothetical protein n=1 Tax=Streptomyces sp. NPDC092295 TaxID=3366011 RepID=UPI003809B261